MSSIEGYLYILHNDVYKQYGCNVYKLGRTVNLKNRMGNYTTPFINKSEYLYVSTLFKDCIKAERILFYLLRKYRIRQQREFFDLPLENIIETIKRLNEFKEITIDKNYTAIVN